MTDPARETLTARPGPGPRTIRTEDGRVLDVPAGWELLPPGDAGLTRKVKAAGPTWTVREKRGRKEFSRGVWAPADTIERCTAAVAAKRDTPAYRQRLAADRQRRERKHQEYAAEFEGQVRDFLAFAPQHRDLEREVAGAIARHATPVGSGTVARTERIPIERRAEAAVIAWLRHQTTGYDRMQIQRVKGRRREVRRELAQRSRKLLAAYRTAGSAPDPCLLTAALAKTESAALTEARAKTESAALTEARAQRAPPAEGRAVERAPRTAEERPPTAPPTPPAPEPPLPPGPSTTAAARRPRPRRGAETREQRDARLAEMQRKLRERMNK